MITTTKIFEKNGKPVNRYDFFAGDFRMSVTNYGAIILSLFVPDRHGASENIVLGYDDIEEYFRDSNFFGATCGRYANRIAGAQFTLNGCLYKLSANEGSNQLHGGTSGFNQKIWDGTVEGSTLTLRYTSPDGEEGYPGALQAEVRFSLDSEGALTIAYHVTSDRDTVVGLTNHSYFNLTGMKENILDHQLQIDADGYTPASRDLIPTGEIRSVAGTPFDFRTSSSISEQLSGNTDDMITSCNGYDVNFALNGTGLRKVASLYERTSGRRMAVHTDMPGLQLYTAGDMAEMKGRDGNVYGPHYGCCLETQRFPNSPNQKNFPSAVLRAGEAFESVTKYIFSID